ncbi:MULTISPECIES: nuclear transport factor 2 family protein [Streptomyces]|uniref:nuclear transport factor 2 family protein n=1 Tax=unclassified Streptomyces TaxID=2593676 RepID=UPI001C2E7F1A|nr:MULTISPECIES: nuclear transport factor 2 family protein [Streptomyces]MBV1940072.1 nuclear transport factor 2 family protein [Streptomyces sp. BV286]WAU86308.1 nuclear transport factor 2 family protein [Streptomyces aurantiacus]
MHPFRKAVEDGDHAAVVDLLAEDVVFTSPVVFKPYAGKPITSAILGAVMHVFEDFRYIREIANPDGRDLALVFEARVGDRALQGCDFLHFDESGRIDDFTVMVRPLSAAQALQAAMAARFDAIAKEASGAS